MTDSKPPSTTQQTDAWKQSRIKQLFGLCEAWVAGGLRDLDFRRETMQLRQQLHSVEWGDTQGGKDGKLLWQFNLAVQCTLAIDQTIHDLKLLARTKNPPAAVRAYHFGKYVSGDAVLELESVLRLGE